MQDLTLEVIMALLLLLLISDVYDETPLTINPDPTYVPGTYEEWILSQPEYQPFCATTISGTDGAEFLLIFEEGLTDSLLAGYLDQWTTDINSQGVSTEVVEVTYSTPADLKTYLIGKYADGLEGAVLVGNLPVPWCVLEDDFKQSGEMFPSDYFYMDLDGIWLDNWIGYPFQGNPGSDGRYDTFTGTLDPEIYIGRIKIDNLYQVADPTDILNDYIQRNHLWRLNGDPEPLNALCYVDNDWASWGNGYQSAMMNLYPNTELVNNEAATNGTDYLNNRLPGNYVWLSPFVHSNPGGHYWEPGPTTTWDQIVPAMPQAHFYNLFACSNARFTTVHCMGSVYSLCTSTGLAAVGSTKSGAMLQFPHFYSPLGLGGSLGEAYRDWWTYIAQGGLSASEKSWHLGMVIIGDPTLIPAMHMLGIEDEGDITSSAMVTFAENPCSGVILISYPAESASVELFDVYGRLVATGNLVDSECTLQASSLQTGCYLVRVCSGRASASATVVLLK